MVLPALIEQGRVFRMHLDHSNDKVPRTRPGDEESALLDVGKLDSLRSLDPEGKAGLLRRVVALFVEKSPPLLEQMSAAVENGNAEEVFRTAHSLKSSCATVGALALSETCRRLEQAGREGALGDAPELLRSIQGQFHQVCGALIRLIEGR
jgi:HPt (histidine-containing phosphotransfer) domain-containing protein